MDPGVAITLLDQALSIQTTYGAVLLSFLGEWGDRSQISTIALAAADVSLYLSSAPCYLRRCLTSGVRVRII